MPIRNVRTILSLVVSVIVLGAAGAMAQGVGINATGAGADTSAILDLSATNKGFLPPRMTGAQRLSIVLPATGLLVYQTDGATGLYYNVGTSAAPSWRQILDSATGGPWALNGTSAFYGGGRVGIGTAFPTHGLSVIDNTAGLRVQTNSAGSALASFGSQGTFQIDSPSANGGRLTLLENGNLGLGATNPTSRLSFDNLLGKKISFYHGTGGDYGVSVASQHLQFYGDPGSLDVAFGVDNNGVFSERFAFKHTGAIAVNGNTGAAGQVLQSNGAASATWVSPTNASYNNLYVVESTASYTIPTSGVFTAAPDLVQVVNVAGNAKLDITAIVRAFDNPCTFCPNSTVDMELRVDGVAKRYITWLLQQGLSANGTLQHVVSVGPGAHTVSVALHVFSSSGAASVQFGGSPAASGNSLIVRVIPQ